LRGEVIDHLPKRLSFLRAPHGRVYGRQPGRNVDDRHVFNRNFAPTGLVAVVVGNQVMRDAVQPGGKRQTHKPVTAEVVQGFQKNPRGQVFRVVHAAHAEVDVVIDAFDVPLIQLSERVRVCFCSFDKLRFRAQWVHKYSEWHYSIPMYRGKALSSLPGIPAGNTPV